jgi:hypothetical protein
MSSTEDFKKYWHALAARSARRVAAEISACSFHAATTAHIMIELTHVLTYQRYSVLVGWPHQDAETDDAGEEFIEVDLGAYSDGRPVYTTVDRGEGMVTLVHHPVSPSFESEDVSALPAEYWPCHHRPRPSGVAGDTDVKA